MGLSTSCGARGEWVAFTTGPWVWPRWVLRLCSPADALAFASYHAACHPHSQRLVRLAICQVAFGSDRSGAACEHCREPPRLVERCASCVVLASHV